MLINAPRVIFSNPTGMKMGHPRRASTVSKHPSSTINLRIRTRRNKAQVVMDVACATLIKCKTKFNSFNAKRNAYPEVDLKVS